MTTSHHINQPVLQFQTVHLDAQGKAPTSTSTSDTSTSISSDTLNDMRTRLSSLEQHLNDIHTSMDVNTLREKVEVAATQRTNAPKSEV